MGGGVVLVKEVQVGWGREEKVKLNNKTSKNLDSVQEI